MGEAEAGDAKVHEKNKKEFKKCISKGWGQGNRLCQEGQVDFLMCAREREREGTTLTMSEMAFNSDPKLALNLTPIIKYQKMSPIY